MLLLKLNAVLRGGEVEQKQSFTQRFQEAVNSSWIPRAALAHLPRLDNTKLIVDDGFRTNLESMGGGEVGYADDSGYEVVVAPTLAKKPERTLTHEFIHVLDGHDRVPFDEESIFRSKETAGLYRIFKGQVAGEAMNEAVVEHLTDSMWNGELDIIDPLSKVRKRAVYTIERSLLHTLAQKGVKKVNVRRFIAAHFEDQDQTEVFGKDSAQTKLVEALREAFPFANVIEELSELKTGETVKETHAAIQKYCMRLERRTNKYLALRVGGAVVAKLRGRTQAS